MSDNITLPREVVQLALEAFEAVMPFSTTQRELKIRAVDALRKALAAEQPKQEPVRCNPAAMRTAASSPAVLFITELDSPEDEALRRENERLREEVRVLRLYGNKDCTAMADEAMKEAALRREET